MGLRQVAGRAGTDAKDSVRVKAFVDKYLVAGVVLGAERVVFVGQQYQEQVQP